MASSCASFSSKTIGIPFMCAYLIKYWFRSLLSVLSLLLLIDLKLYFETYCVMILSSSSLLLAIWSFSVDSCSASSLILSTKTDYLPFSKERIAVVWSRWRKINLCRSISWFIYDWLCFISFSYFLARLIWSAKQRRHRNIL